MTKIRSIKFNNHPILGNLSLDFCLPSGETADTIILAGENGTGKSVLLTSLYQLITNELEFEAEVQIECDGNIIDLKYYDYFSNNSQRVFIIAKSASIPRLDTRDLEFKRKYGMFAIYADTGINYKASEIRNVTSIELDAQKESQRSTSNLATQIEQTLIDIDALDNSDFARAYKEREKLGQRTEGIPHGTRIHRFSNAFDTIFNGLSFDRISNIDNHKTILFQKHGKDIPIQSLSSGEKQIIYRGGFLLKDLYANTGALVFIDEPETALHPNWQKKILSFYKNIFTDTNGQQTSQIFIVTHSPFIIHDTNPIRDKVIVLKRDVNDNVVAHSSPEYYYCSGTKAIEDAFNIRDFSDAMPTIYLEGRTDEKYFKKALELSGITDFPFTFKWIGHFDTNGNEANSGKDALNKAFQFLIAQKPTKLNICLSDCDTNKEKRCQGNVLSMSLPKFESNPAGITVGIENALCVSKDFFDGFVNVTKKTDKYGLISIRPEPDKMKMCDTICYSLQPKEQREILANLIAQLKNLKQLYSDHMEAINNTSNV